jgi:hypothetical protein
LFRRSSDSSIDFEADPMDLTGSGYLFAFTEVSLAFVGFSAVVVALRSAMGGAPLSDFQILLVRLDIEGGLSATGLCFLPALLALFGLRASLVWTLASVSFAGCSGLMHAVYFGRRRRVGPLPSWTALEMIRTYIHYTIGTAAIAAALLNAAGTFSEPNAAPYAMALSLYGLEGGLIFRCPSLRDGRRGLPSGLGHDYDERSSPMRGHMQQLNLSEHEAELLRGLLRDHLPDLQREAARTEQHDLRHLLIERQELVRRLLTMLGSGTGS